MKKIANLLVCAFLVVTSLASCRNEEVQVYSIPSATKEEKRL